MTNTRSYEIIPPLVRKAMDNYYSFGTPPESNGFVEALLHGDCELAILRADDDSFAALRAIVLFMHNEWISQAYGTLEKYAEWIEQKGLQGHEHKELIDDPGEPVR